MKYSFGSRVFAPAWWSILATAVFLGVFIKLGFWQLHRAEEKRALMQQAQQGQQQMVTYTGNAEALARYQQVRLMGHYDAEHQVLLDNMPSAQGQPGYRVLTPLLTEANEVVLVDRGWVPWLASRDQLPTIAVDTALRTVVGILDDLPAPGIRAGDAGIRAGSWPQRLNFPAHDELQRLLGRPLARRIVLLNPDQPDGYARQWRISTVGFDPERHVAYAVQWFGFAITVLIVFIVLNLKRLSS